MSCRHALAPSIPRLVDQVAQAIGVAAKGALACRGDGGAGAGAFADEILGDRRIACRFQCVQMAAEIAVGRARQLLQPREFQRFELSRGMRRCRPRSLGGILAC